MKKMIIFVTLTICTFLFSEIKIERIVQLTNDKVKYESPKWSPDGTMIAFVRSDYGGLVVINSDGTNLRHLVKESVHSARGFVWSEDSEEITYRSGNRNVNTIKIVNVKTGNIELVTTSISWISYPIWQYSENGKRAAWVDGDGKLFHSESKPLKGEEYKEIYKKHNYDKNIIYAGGWSKNSNNMYIVIDNEGKVKKDFNLEKYMAEWSPDRGKISYYYDGFIFIMDEFNKSMSKLGPGYPWSWSPNSDKIIYCKVEEDMEITSSDLIITDIYGENKKQLTNTKDELEFYPDWSPDGEKIVYNSAKTGNIYLIYLEEK